MRGMLFALLSLLLVAPIAQAGVQSVKVDGSSTLAPVTTAAAEMFGSEFPRIRVTVGISGTGGGFKKFLSDRPNLRTDINDASRPISKTEKDRAAELGVEYVEIPIAIDGIAVVVHPENHWVDYLSVEELREIWKPGSQIKNWSQIREGFPDIPLRLYGPGPDSGTFDYFTEEIIGKARSCRSDYTASESDNMLVIGTKGSKDALAYFGFSYYEAHKDGLKIVPIKHKGDPVKPTLEVIKSGKYTPLSRPLFMYVSVDALNKKPAVKKYLDYIIDNAEAIVEHPIVNYVALPPELYEVVRHRLDNRVTGSAMETAHGGSLMEIFSKH